MTARIICGDCLDVMREMDAASVDAIVTDPPYCSGARKSADMPTRGGMQRAQKWKAKPLDSDQMTATGYVWLMRQVGRDAVRLLKSGGWFVCFIDWRQYPTLYGALESCDLRVSGMLVWDKQNFALGNGFRNQHELAIVATKGSGTAHNHATGNVISIPRLRASEIHPTEKPVDLFRPILKVVCPVGGLVLDPFAGSGTTGVAALLEGMDSVGIERDPQYTAVAERRLAEQRGAATLDQFAEVPA